MFSDAEVVLNTLSEVEGLDDVQQIVDRVCRCVVDISGYELALLSVYFESAVYVGLVGGSEEMRRRFEKTARDASREGRVRKRQRMWQCYRIPDTNIVWIPEGSDVPFGPAFEPSEEVEGAEWRPDDRLMVFVRGTGGEVHGVLSLDKPTDGRRPDPSDLGVIHTVDRLMTLMGAVIHNKYLAATLRESEERYGAVVEQGHDGILITREGRILFANRRISEMLECPPESLVGRRLSSIVRGGHEDVLAVEPTGTLVKSDGTGVEVSLRQGPIRFGGATATLVAAADITERQRMLAQLMRAQKLESVGTLASGIAHDFNNILSGIVGYASLLKTRLARGDPVLRYVEAIEHATQRAAGVTRQLLGMTRDQEVHVAPVDLARVLEELERLLCETFDPAVRVEVRCQAGLPQVMGDETQIHQILLNVSLNARDAMPQGGRLLIEAERTEGCAVRIQVRDTGEGMDADTLSRVFDPFFTTKAAGHGSGLGLFMAYRIVERHGGTMDISSAEGRGTTVEFVLPAREEARSIAAPDAGPEELEAGGTVLLVDDEALVLDVCGEMLRRLGYEVITALDGRHAVRAVQNARNDLCCVIMDIAMPNMNGWEASRFIRVLKPELPIVISSGHDISAETGNTRGIQLAGVLKKPYGLDDVRAVLQQAAAITASAAS